MVDTIVMRIHNLTDKETLLTWLRLSERNAQFDSIITVPSSDADRWIMLKSAQYRDSGKTVTSIRNKWYIKSSSYYLNYIINLDKDFIEFNFSIPKYKYGTNVAQFVPHYRARDFMITTNSDFQFNLDRTFQRLMVFIERFFNKFVGVEFEKMKKDIEIHRFDICFNQVFDDKKDALEYLTHQKKVKKRGERLINSKLLYPTSIYQAGKYFTFKIYHKGSEFWKNDAPELRKTNKLLRQRRFNVEKIGDFADRVLRYEIEFKAAGLNYLFKRYLFRKNSKSFNSYKRNWRITQKVERWSKCKSKTFREKAFAYMKRDEWRGQQRQAYYYTQMISQVSSFRLAISRDAACSAKRDMPDEYRKGGKIVIEKTALFSKELFSLCAKNFKKFFRWYQLGSKTQINNLEKTVMDANARVKMMKRYGEKEKGVRFSNLAKFLNLMATYGEKHLLQTKMYSRVQIWRIKKELKVLGYKEMPVTDYGIKHDDTFEAYHQFMIDSLMMSRL